MWNKTIQPPEMKGPLYIYIIYDINFISFQEWYVEQGFAISMKTDIVQMYMFVDHDWWRYWCSHYKTLSLHMVAVMHYMI